MSSKCFHFCRVILSTHRFILILMSEIMKSYILSSLGTIFVFFGGNDTFSIIMLVSHPRLEQDALAERRQLLRRN